MPSLAPTGAHGLTLEPMRLAAHRDDDRLILQPVPRMPSLGQVLAELEPLEEEFPEIADPPTGPEDIF